MIQDLGTHCYRNEYQPVPPKGTDCILYFEDRKVLVHNAGETFSFPTFSEAEKACTSVYTDYIYLFSIDDTRYYFSSAFTPDCVSDCTMEDIVIFRNLGPQENGFALITAYQLFQWYQTRKFCGKCGTALVHSQKERMMECPNCQNTEYPKISPAVIVAVRDQNRLLLTKYAGRNALRYALIAGFSEVGETVEETVHREVLEEVGLKVKNLRYYKSQPWSLSSSLLMGFVCDLDGDNSVTLDENELSVAQWFERDEIPYDDYDVSLTREMMIEFKKGRL